MAERATAADPRWLARRVLAGPAAGLSDELPPPCGVRQALEAAPTAARDYLVGWVARADAAGAFARRTRWWRHLPKPLLLRLLLAAKYEGLVYMTSQCFFGHVFYQQHGSELHGFSTAVSAEFEGRGLSVVMLLDFVAFASRASGITRARVGRGMNNTTRRLLERLREHGQALEWDVGVDDGWVCFPATANHRVDCAPEQDASAAVSASSAKLSR